MSDYECIRDECWAKPCLPDSGTFNAGVELYESLRIVLEMNVRLHFVPNSVVLVMIVFMYNHVSAYTCTCVSLSEMNVGPNLVFNTVVLTTLV